MEFVELINTYNRVRHCLSEENVVSYLLQNPEEFENLVVNLEKCLPKSPLLDDTVKEEKSDSEENDPEVPNFEKDELILVRDYDYQQWEARMFYDFANENKGTVWTTNMAGSAAHWYQWKSIDWDNLDQYTEYTRTELERYKNFKDKKEGFVKNEIVLVRDSDNEDWKARRFATYKNGNPCTYPYPYSSESLLGVLSWNQIQKVDLDNLKQYNVDVRADIQYLIDRGI